MPCTKGELTGGHTAEIENLCSTNIREWAADQGSSPK
jgi:hypothetical protein